MACPLAARHLAEAEWDGSFIVCPVCWLVSCFSQGSRCALAATLPWASWDVNGLSVSCQLLF